MESQNGKFGAFMRGLLVGGAIGALFGILKAPQSGEETVALLKQKSSETKAELEQRAHDARVRAEEIISEAEAKAEQIKKSAEEALEAKRA